MVAVRKMPLKALAKGFRDVSVKVRRDLLPDLAAGDFEFELIRHNRLGWRKTTNILVIHNFVTGYEPGSN
jgi:hypothetical protein